MANLKTWLKRAVGAVVFLALLAAMVMRLDSALKLVQEDNLCGRYYDYPDDTFDVTFLGSSFALYAIYPMELYRDFGIASYNLATSNQSIEASYCLARESIEKDHPDLIVIDCNLAWADQETMKSEYIHYITDTMPYFRKNRIAMIRELAQEGEDLNPILFPLIAYHSRWQEVTYQDALPQAKELVYGCKVTSRVESLIPFEDPQKVEGAVLPESSVNYLQKTIDLCRENNTELLLINIPALGQNKFFSQTGYNHRWTASRELGIFAAKNNIPYLDYFAEWKKLGFDLQTDAMDGEHLNRWGAARFTSLLGKYMKEHYDLPDRRGGGSAYDVIDRDLERYPVNRMRDSLRTAQHLQDYAATLRSDACQSEGSPVEDALVLITLNGKVDNSILTQDTASVIQSFGIRQDLSRLENRSWLAVIDGGEILYETVPGEEDAADSYEGTAGDLHYTVSSGRVEEETGRILSDASIKVNALEYTSDNRGLHFAVFDKSTGELMDSCWIDINSSEFGCTHDYQ